jgi:uncharacterized protein (DUF2141 family)
MQKMLTSLLPKFGALWIGLHLPSLSLPETNVIGVHVQNLRSDKGQVICSLFSSPEGFPKDSRKSVRRVTSAISDKQASCFFFEIPPGTYALAVFHDENSNGKLDTNFLGIPREGVGASNGATGHLGPPKFDAAAFQFSGGRLNLEIVIHYL